ncbi:MAG TPA: SGNH/GDSL hydrolase family protein [Methylibium sp.]
MNRRDLGRAWGAWGKKSLTVACALATALLASCGGGGSSVNPFYPDHIIAFGDESSVINSDGSKYTINALNTSNQLDCASNPIWVQYLAANFGIVFSQCNPNADPNPKGVMFAKVGAKVADVVSQVQQYQAGNSIGSKDLFTILVGQNDILSAFLLYGAQSETDLIAAVEAQGVALGQLINSIATAGGKVIVVTVPDMGLTPYAIVQESRNPGSAAVLSHLTDRFNVAMRTTIINDGSMIGLVLGDELTQSIAQFPQNFGYTNVTLAACSVALPACTTSTLITDPSNGNPATGTTFLWASDRVLGPGAQLRIGQSAVLRARNNPF